MPECPGGMQGCPGGCRDARCRRDARGDAGVPGAAVGTSAAGMPSGTCRVPWDAGMPEGFPWRGRTWGAPGLRVVARQRSGLGAVQKAPPPRAGGLPCVCPIVLGWGQGPPLPGDRGSSPLLLPRGGGSAASPRRSPWPWGCSAVSPGEGQLIPWGRSGLGVRDRDGLGWADRGRLWKRVNVCVSVHISVHGAASLFPRPHRHAHRRE